MQSQSTLTNRKIKKDGNAIGLQRLVNSCKQANKNNSRSLVGDFRISNLEGFPQKVKCEACSQLA
jgi:hypothetical protein